jgi:hypothetical protein
MVVVELELDSWSRLPGQRGRLALFDYPRRPPD